MSDQPTEPEPQPQEPQPDPEPAEGEPSSHESSGQFPADEVRATHLEK